MTVVTDFSRRSNCVKIVRKGGAIVRKGGAIVSQRKERARRVYKVGCPKVKLKAGRGRVL